MASDTSLLPLSGVNLLLELIRLIKIKDNSFFVRFQYQLVVCTQQV